MFLLIACATRIRASLAASNAGKSGARACFIACFLRVALPTASRKPRANFARYEVTEIGSCAFVVFARVAAAIHIK